MKKYFSSPVSYLVFFLFAIGTILHFAPFLNYQRTIFSISEDGYLMMTIARNIALGLGMSTAEGTLPTNGTQPLMTFLMSVIYMIVNGDKITSIRIIIFLEWLISAAGVLIILAAGRKIIKDRENAGEISLLAAAIWYSSPSTFIHTMNALETGLYGIAVMAAISYFVLYKGNFNYTFFLKAGIIFGILFWLRNDAVFFILPAAFILYYYNKADKKIVYKILFSFIIAGLIALPWIIYNYVNFNSFMPVSGQAEMINSRLGGNIIVFPSVVLEYIFLILPVPYSMHINIPVFIVSLLVLGIIIYAIKKNWQKIAVPGQKTILFFGFSLLLFFIFYGVFFETYYFVPRYLFPFSTFLIMLPLIFIYSFNKIIKSKLYIFAQVIFLALLIGISYIRLEEGNVHNHFHLYKWVEKNTSGEEWIGAFQSGMIGYFHDRTINLDGKVNPEALKALKEDRIYNYIADKKIDYIVNWQSTSMIYQFEPIRNNYNLIVNDTDANISVFKRK